MSSAGTGSSNVMVVAGLITWTLQQLQMQNGEQVSADLPSGWDDFFSVTGEAAQSSAPSAQGRHDKAMNRSENMMLASFTGVKVKDNFRISAL
nr:hypothetical protein [Flavobacterium magnum]